MAANGPTQSRARSAGAAVRPYLQEIFDPRSMQRSLNAYVFQPAGAIGQPVVDAADIFGRGTLNVLTAGGKVPPGIGPLYTGLVGLGDFSTGVLLGDKGKEEKSVVPTAEHGYKPGLYAPGPMSSVYDNVPPPSEPSPAPNPYDPRVAFIPGPAPISGGGGGPAPPMRPIPAPFDPNTIPAAPQRAPLNQDINPYFAEEEKSLEAARPLSPHFDNKTLILRALAGAAIGAAVGGDVGAAFAGGLTGLTSGMERRETQKEKFERELEAYNLRKAGFESRKGTYRANLAEKQGDVDYSNAAAKYNRDLEVERLRRSQDEKRDDILWQNRRDMYSYQSEQAKIAAENAKALQPKYSMSDGMIYMQQYRPPENGRPGGMEVSQVPLDPILHEVERSAKIAKAIRETTGTSGEQSVALNPTKIELPPGKEYVRDAVLVSEMNNSELNRQLQRTASIKVLYELNRLPENFSKLPVDKQDEEIRRGKDTILQETGDLKQFDEAVERLKRTAAIRHFWMNPDAGRAAASERIRP